MGGFNFDFSSLNPYITGLANRSMQALDYNIAQLPKRESMNDRAYADWLNNNASKRGIAEGEFDMRRRGFDAAEALSARQEKQAANDRYAQQQREVAVNVPGPSTPYYGAVSKQWGDTANRMNRMARAGIPIATYDPIDRMATAAAGGGATQAASANARSGGCPPGYAASPFGGCQPSGTGWGARE